MNIISKLINLIKQVPFLVLFPIGSLTYFLTNSFTQGNTMHIVKWKIDDYIPFSPIWIIPYWYWYIFMVVAVILVLYKNKNLANKLMYAILTSSIFNNIIYACYQTTVPRPELTQNDIFTYFVSLAYSNDNPVNCLPSTHVSVTVVLCIFLFIAYKKNVTIQIFNIMSGILICLSTVFVKQHYVPDVVAGVLVAIWFSATPVLNMVKKYSSKNNLIYKIYSKLNLAD